MGVNPYVFAIDAKIKRNRIWPCATATATTTTTTAADSDSSS